MLFVKMGKSFDTKEKEKGTIKFFLKKFVSQNAKISRFKKLTQGMIQNQQN